MGSERSDVKVVRLSRREKERKILEMWESGHSYKEICQALRVSPKTVAKVLHREEEGEGEDIERLIEERVNERLNECLGDIEKRLAKLEDWRERVCSVIADVDRKVNLARLNERVKGLEDFSLRLEGGLLWLCHAVERMDDYMRSELGYWYSDTAIGYVREFERYLEERRERRKEEAKKLRQLTKVRSEF